MLDATFSIRAILSVVVTVRHPILIACNSREVKDVWFANIVYFPESLA